MLPKFKGYSIDLCFVVQTESTGVWKMPEVLVPDWGIKLTMAWGCRTGTPAYVACAGIFKQSMGARNRIGIGLSYRPAWLHRLAELIPQNRFLCSLKVKKFGLCWRIDSLESTLGLFESLKNRALAGFVRQPYVIVNFIPPNQGTKNWASVLQHRVLSFVTYFCHDPTFSIIQCSSVRLSPTTRDL